MAKSLSNGIKDVVLAIVKELDRKYLGDCGQNQFQAKKFQALHQLPTTMNNRLGQYINQRSSKILTPLERGRERRPFNFGLSNLGHCLTSHFTPGDFRNL